MAIVFISIKKRQRLVFWGICLLFLVSVGLLSAWALLPELISGPDTVVSEPVDIPSIQLNFNALDSDQVKSLEPFLPSGAIEGEGAGRDNPFQ